jgi:orotidine-5'-phosphate decarboxylase
MTGAERICAAVDVPALAEAEPFARQVAPHVGMLKVGLELFAAEGPAAVRALAALGRPVFLDLKLHDIPETVGRATAAAASLGVDLITVHSGGGRAMMARAAKEAHERGARVIAVTVLTSLDEHDLEEVRIKGPLVELVIARAKLAQDAGCDGVVASPQEAAAIRAACGPGFLIVTPGVRPAGASVGDQKRVATPRSAVQAGADYIVVGRPITGAPDARSAALAIAEELVGG